MRPPGIFMRLPGIFMGLPGTCPEEVPIKRAATSQRNLGLKKSGFRGNPPSGPNKDLNGHQTQIVSNKVKIPWMILEERLGRNKKKKQAETGQNVPKTFPKN